MNKLRYKADYQERYLKLFQEFTNYLTIYKLDKLERFPKSSNIVFFDDYDEEFSEYSNNILKKLLDEKAENIFEVRRTKTKNMPWKISEPLNIL